MYLRKILMYILKNSITKCFKTDYSLQRYVYLPLAHPNGTPSWGWHSHISVGVIMVPGERRLGTPVNLLLIPLGHGKNSSLPCIPVICEQVSACCHVTQCLFPLHRPTQHLRPGRDYILGHPRPALTSNININSHANITKILKRGSILKSKRVMSSGVPGWFSQRSMQLLILGL